MSVIIKSYLVLGAPEVLLNANWSYLDMIIYFVFICDKWIRFY